jgi:signal transduction histidine kinase
MGTLAGTGLSTGHGLASLAERVRMAGGSLASGPRPEGGFRVTATLPLSTTPVPVAG